MFEAMRKYWLCVGGTIDWTMFGLGSVLHAGGPCYKLWGDMESEPKRPIRSSKYTTSHLRRPCQKPSAKMIETSSGA